MKGQNLSDRFEAQAKPPAAPRHQVRMEHTPADTSGLPPLIILELFSGTGSVSKALTPEFLHVLGKGRSIQIVSLDTHVRGEHKPDIQESLLDWDYKTFCDEHEGNILFVWGSPPCAPHSP